MSEPQAAPSAAPEFGGRQLLKLAVEIGPLLIFFLVNARAGIFAGTASFMITTPIALIASRLLFGRVAIMPLVSGFFILVFGALTLWLQDELFIKMKPTILNGLFAIVLFTGLATGRSLLKYVFGEIFFITDEGWRKLTFRWACFFLALAVLNEIVWRAWSTDAWVAFKVFGIMPLTMAFALAQLGLLSRHQLAADGPKTSAQVQGATE